MDASPRLLCDEMLHRLGRWLRAAGYDTVIAGNGTADGAILAQAQAEDRVLVTRDRALAARAGPAVRTFALDSDRLDEGARQLRDRLGIDWCRAPFTRCLVDNTPLRAAEPSEHARVPPGAHAPDGTLTTCPACGRLYWPGGHVRRMLARLAEWQGRDGRTD